MTLQKMYNTFCLPALIIHELLHYIAIKLTFAYYSGVSVDFDDDFDSNGMLCVAINYSPDNKIQDTIILMAPFLGMFIWLIPFLLGYDIFGIVYLLYTLSCITTVIPSKHDFNSLDILKNKKSSQK